MKSMAMSKLSYERLFLFKGILSFLFTCIEVSVVNFNVTLWKWSKTLVFIFQSCLARVYSLLKMSIVCHFALCKLIKLGDTENLSNPRKISKFCLFVLSNMSVKLNRIRLFCACAPVAILMSIMLIYQSYLPVLTSQYVKLKFPLWNWMSFFSWKQNVFSNLTICQLSYQPIFV